MSLSKNSLNPFQQKTSHGFAKSVAILATKAG